MINVIIDSVFKTWFNILNIKVERDNMEKKYWVPALDRADTIITIIANEPKQHKLMDLSKKTGINKSSLFSVLNTLEELGWIYKEVDQTYALGPKLGLFGSRYIQQFDLTRLFYQEAEKTTMIVEEPIQMSVLEGKEIIYIAKEEGSSVVRIATEPGMRLPAHATAMGKVMLSTFSDEKLTEMYKGDDFKRLTDKTVDNLGDLQDQINDFKQNGYIIESQETVKGFTCIAAPVRNEKNEIIAAVSFTMTLDKWEKKSELSKREILDLSKKLSLNNYIYA